jgi:hypothetical protein
MSLPYLAEFGWSAHVLAVDPRYVEGFRDTVLLQTVPDDIPVTHVPALPAGVTRLFGLGSLGLRAYAPLSFAGDRLLRTRRFDLVYFSTTVFPSMGLGPVWKRRWGVPFVLDMQDPWVNDYYDRAGVKPPGGRLKYAFAQWLARRAEPAAMRGASRIISVSPGYPVSLRQRYPDLDADKFVVLPFGGSERDAEFVCTHSVQHTVFEPADGLVHWTYLGRGGADMGLALRGLFLALRTVRATDARINRLRLHFVGTSYASPGRAQPSVAPLARELGVDDLVSEQTGRIPYLEGLALLRSSDAVLLIGSDDASYSASKVYPCLLSARPLLAITHRDSLVGEVIRSCSNGAVAEFATGESAEVLAMRVEPELRRLLDLPRGTSARFDRAAFSPYTAREMTRRQCEVFDAALCSAQLSGRMMPSKRIDPLRRVRPQMAEG